ncbi:MAG: hypothetical protein ACFFA0_10705 [Promethearchaeota archaeon]
MAGVVCGVLYSLINRESNQDILKLGIVVGILGGIVSSCFISSYETIIVIVSQQGNIFVFFLFLGTTLISAAVIGLLAGAVISTYFLYKDMTRVDVEDDHLDDKFFDDLIDK